MCPSKTSAPALRWYARSIAPIRDRRETIVGTKKLIAAQAVSIGCAQARRSIGLVIGGMLAMVSASAVGPSHGLMNYVRSRRLRGNDRYFHSRLEPSTRPGRGV